MMNAQTLGAWHNVVNGLGKIPMENDAMVRSGAKAYVSLCGIDVVLAGLFTLTLRWYYARYHFGVGPRFAALMIGFPVAIVLGSAAGFGAFAIARRRGARANAALGIATASIALVQAMALGLEWYRTTNVRSRTLEALMTAAPYKAL